MGTSPSGSRFSHCFWFNPRICHQNMLWFAPVWISLIVESWIQMHDDTSHLCMVFLLLDRKARKAKEKSRDIVDPCPHSPARTGRTGGKGKAMSPRTPRKGFLNRPIRRKTSPTSWGCFAVSKPIDGTTNRPSFPKMSKLTQCFPKCFFKYVFPTISTTHH